MSQELAKFNDLWVTAKGEKRAWVKPTALKTLWFNTGTQCNLTCANCYIESSPTNDRLVYLTPNDMQPFLDEVQSQHSSLHEIGLTGGEPFMNPYIMDILASLCQQAYSVLVLTNAMKPMQKNFLALTDLHKKYPGQLSFRISVDHYTQKVHEQERGPRAWQPMIEGVHAMIKAGMTVSIAGRSLTNESHQEVMQGYQTLFDAHQWPLKADDPKDLIVFAEMNPAQDVPEITTGCWSILNKDPKNIMCASSRMVVKKKGKKQPEVIACTLLPYEQAFSLGTTLQEAWQPVSLNHAYCATFCVLGGSSCS